MRIAWGEADDRGVWCDHDHQGSQERRGLTIAYQDVVPSRVPSKVRQRSLVKALPVHGGTYFIVVDVTVAWTHPPLQAREVEDGLPTTLENPLSDVATSLGEFEELCFAAVQNGSPRIGQSWREGVAESVGSWRPCSRVCAADDSVRFQVSQTTNRSPSPRLEPRWRHH